MEIVYFGSLDSLDEPDGDLMFLKSASMIDRYEFFQDRPAFYVNNDPACAAEYDLDLEKQNLLLF